MNQLINWENYPRLYCFPNECNCEIMHTGLIVQPSAVITSLPFIFIGIWGLKKAQTFEFKLLAWIYIFLGFSSIFLHSSMILISRFFDYGAIYLIMSWSLVYLYHKKTSHLNFFLWTIVIGSLMTSLLAIFKKYPVGIFNVWAIVTLIFSFARVQSFNLSHHQKKNLYISVFFLAIGGLCFMLDQWRLFCFHDYYLYGHSAWHVLVSVSLFYHYKFFEEIVQHHR